MALLFDQRIAVKIMHSSLHYRKFCVLYDSTKSCSFSSGHRIDVLAGKILSDENGRNCMINWCLDVYSFVHICTDHCTAHYRASMIAARGFASHLHTLSLYLLPKTHSDENEKGDIVYSSVRTRLRRTLCTMGSTHPSFQCRTFCAKYPNRYETRTVLTFHLKTK